MIKIEVKKQSNYPVSSTAIKTRLKRFLSERGIVSDAKVEVALVGEKEMGRIGREYLGEDAVHNVLSFPADETKSKFVFPPDGYLYLGEIMICYPQAFEEAREEGKLIEEKVLELAEHGALHLIGIHHENT